MTFYTIVSAAIWYSPQVFTISLWIVGIVTTAYIALKIVTRNTQL